MRASKVSFGKWSFGILAVLALAIGAYALVLYGNPDKIPDQQFTIDKGELPQLWYSMIWAHAVSSGIALAVGWLQFIKSLRARKPLVHKMIGLLYTAGISIGAVTGLYLAVYAEGGWIAKLGFAALSISWIFTLYHGLHSIFVKRDAAAHGRWMLRNYALTCAAIMLRIYVPLAAVLFGLTDTNDTFAVIAWLCWVPNLLAVNFLIARRQAARQRLRTR